MRSTGLTGTEVTEADGPLWDRQRAGQRSARAAVVRVAAPPSALPAVLRATDAAGGTLVGRAGLGLAWVELEPACVPGLRAAIAAIPRSTSVVLDAPAALRHGAWGPAPPARTLALMQAVKARFDPAATCNPGIYVGGI